MTVHFATVLRQEALLLTQTYFVLLTELSNYLS